MDSSEDGELDPRIHIELESLNTATDDINNLEIELEEANSTFRILLNESTRRLKLLSKKLGNCIEKARPYYEAQEKARISQVECQAAAVKFQRSNEIHAAAKETVALAEQRFMSNSHEWQFDNAWQEMLNHATTKVMDAEKQKTESHAEHQKKANIFSEAEMKVQQLEDKFRRSIQKSRPYFDEKQICQDQLQTQKDRIQELQAQIQSAKKTYSTSLKNLEQISEEIHKLRGNLNKVAPPGPREPGVGAELQHIPESTKRRLSTIHTNIVPTPVIDFESELHKCDQTFWHHTSSSATTSLAVSEKGDDDEEDSNDVDDLDLEELRKKVKVLAVRPVEGGDGQQTQDVWETELNDTVNKLDHLMMIRESAMHQQNPSSLPSSPIKQQKQTNLQIKMLNKAEPLASANVSMKELPILTRLSNEFADRTQTFPNKRRLSLE